MKYKIVASITLFLSLIALIAYLGRPGLSDSPQMLLSDVQTQGQSQQSDISSQQQSELQPQPQSIEPQTSIVQPVNPSSVPPAKVTQSETPVATTAHAKEEAPTSLPEISSSQVFVPPENYGYSLLSQSEQEVYRQLLSGFDAMAAEIPVTPTPIQTFQKIYTYVINDNPQLFWVDISGYTYYYYGGKVNKIVQPFLIAADAKSSMAAQVEARAATILSGLSSSMDDYNKALYLHDVLVNSIVYDADASMMHNIYGALVTGRAVCDGYSRAYQYLCSRSGIPALLVTGTAQSGGTNGGHAWNMIYLSGAYYHVDVTWNDPDYPSLPGFVWYIYFGLTTQQISSSHTIVQGTGYPIPDATATQCNYYIKEGLSFAAYGSAKNGIQIKMQEMNPSKKLYLQARFSADSYSDAKRLLLSDTNQMIAEVNPTLGNKISKITLYFYDTFQIAILVSTYY